MIGVYNTGRHTIISGRYPAHNGAGYSLYFDNDYARYPETVKKDGLEVCFKVREAAESEYIISGRDFCDYVDERSFPDLPLDPDLRYVEVGPGMGGLLKHAVEESGGRMRHKPVAIEPSNIGLMKILMQFALRCGDVSQRHKGIVSEYMSRLELLEDSSRITLVNMKLGSAIVNCPWLEGYADVVVELAGPSTYTWTEGLSILEDSSARAVVDMERRLLRPSGVLFNSHLKSRDSR